MSLDLPVVRAANGSETSTMGPLPASSRRQQVVDVLRDAIISGDLVPGEQLKQDVLAARLTVSPGPVREALRQLESEGLVEHFPNRGVFVCDITTEEFLGVLLPVRSAIETFAVPLAARAMTSDQLAELQGIVEAMEMGAQAGDLRGINELDVQFHELTVKASGSTHALQLWHTVGPRIRAQIYRLAPRHRDAFEIAVEHRSLLEAIRTQDEPTIVSAVNEHIHGTAQELLDAARGDEGATHP
jgi:DNA-binding GntR family transcriptional regulator